MSWIDKLERRFGRYAVRNLAIYLILGYMIGFMIDRAAPEVYYNYLSLDASAILHGQVWRIFTYLLYPPASDPIWLLIETMIFFSLGRTLEELWGSFRFNLYILIGVLGNVVAALVIYLIWGQVWLLTASGMYLSIILGLAMTIPDLTFRLYFVIPIKAKWIGIFYVVLEVMNFVSASAPEKVMIALSFANVILFFSVIYRPVQKVQAVKRRQDFEKKVKMAVPTGGTRHRCAVCGRTEEDDPNLEFRFCSKCDGDYEYCLDHLYTHIHVSNDNHQH